jgi:hypothetical protein
VGAYVYKAKVKPLLGSLIGFYDFWYKPSYMSYGNPYEMKQEHMRGVIMDNLKERYPDGVELFAYAPTNYDRDLRKDVWDKNERKALYWNGQRGPVVMSDESRASDVCLNPMTIVGEVWGSKTGKVHINIDGNVAIRHFEKQYHRGNATEDEIEKILENQDRFRERFRLQLRTTTLEVV